MRSEKIKRLSILIGVIFFSISLVSCGLGSYNTTSLAAIHLPGGSQVIMLGDSDIEAPQWDGVEERGVINEGEILVVSQLPSGTWFTFANSLGYIARVTADPNVPGAIMRLVYNRSTGNFTLDCIKGICDLGADYQRLTTLLFGNRAWLDLGGNIQGPQAFDLNPVTRVYGPYIQGGSTSPTTDTSTIPGVETPTSTPDFAATATESCIQFSSQFPSTPCP
jgi:hypothetical protein